jgi:cold shock CspA family protein
MLPDMFPSHSQEFFLGFSHPETTRKKTFVHISTYMVGPRRNTELVKGLKQTENLGEHLKL